jgi:hypothetical protein
MGIVVDSKLVARAVALSGERTKKAAVTKALQEYISQRRNKKQRELLNKVQWISAPGKETNRQRR